MPAANKGQAFRSMKRFILKAGITSIVVMAGSFASLEAAELGFRTDSTPALLYLQAYQNMPQLSDEDSKHLFDNWRGGAFRNDDHARELLKQYDNSDRKST